MNLPNRTDRPTDRPTRDSRMYAYAYCQAHYLTLRSVKQFVVVARRLAKRASEKAFRCKMQQLTELRCAYACACLHIAYTFDITVRVCVDANKWPPPPPPLPPSETEEEEELACESIWCEWMSKRVSQRQRKRKPFSTKLGKERINEKGGSRIVRIQQ